MYSFSTKTLVNKEYKLTDFLKQIKASKDVREDAKKIKKIIFQNIINSRTLNINVDDNKYKEIYVIKLVLNVDDVPQLFIEELDKFIKFHTYFICEYDGFVMTELAFKEIGIKAKIVSKYYKHPFKYIEEKELPLINSVSDVYNYLLEYEIQIPLRKDEIPDDYIKRVAQINKLEFQISKTEKAIIYETQPKKKFEYNERLREYKKDLEELKKVVD